MARDDNPFFDLANIDLSAGPPRDAMYSGFVPGANPMARKAEQQRLMRESKGLTPAAALMRGLGEGYFGDITTPNAEQGYSVMDASSRAPAGREAEMQRYRDVGTALGIVADPATMLAPFAKPAAKAVGRGALATAKGMGETMNNRMLAGESLIPGLPQAVAPNPLMFAVKPKGGNWRPALKDQKNDIEQAMLPLEQRGPTTREAAIAEGGQWRMQTDEFGNPYTFADSPEGQTIMANTGALNRWLNKKLKPYIQNELGTPDDPIRLAHEQGYSHMPAFAEFGEWLPDNAATMRRQAGFPEEGFASRRHAESGFPEANAANAQSAENWENLSDSLIGSANARRYQGFADIAKEFSGTPPPEYQHYFDLIEQNPWLTKAEPDTKIYELLMPYELPDQLGFKHMVDELRASLSPNSELPEHMRLTPDSLSKVSVADAVKRVSEINSWRALQAEKAEQAGMLENLNSNARLADPTAQLSFVEKPGMTWVDIPEVVDAKGTKLCTDIGRQGGWCTMNRDTAKEYGSGNSRLVALLDAEGRPHAQAMIIKSSKSPYDEWFDKNGGDVKAPEVAEFLAWVEARAKAGGSKMNANQLYLDWSAETGRLIVPPVQNIEELKPPGNTFSSDRSNAYKKRDPDYQKKVSESVVKFLNSGEWGTVNDLHHYGVTDDRDKNSWLRVLQRVSPERDIEKAVDNFSSALSSNPDLPRFMTDKDIAQLLGAPPAESYAEGGAVHMQVGGAASLARRLFKPSAIVSPHVEQMAKAIALPTSRTFSDEEIKSLLDASIVSRRKIPTELINQGDALKTVFDTNKTGAANAKISKLRRGVREPELFSGELGQTYAALLEDPNIVVPENIWSSYGNYGLEFKPEIKSRTTISIGDLSNYGGLPETARLFSLIDNDQFPVLRDLAREYLEAHPKIKNSRRLLDPKISDRFGKDDQGFWDWAGLTPIKNEYKLPFAGVRKVPRDLTDLSKVPLSPHEQKLLESDPISEILNLNVRNNDPTRSNNNLDFIEAQIHGPVTTEDIARVYDYGREPSLKTEKQFKKLGIDYVPVESQDYAEGGSVKSDFFIDPSSYAQSRSKQMFPKQKNEWTQQDAARHMLASGMMAQKFGPTVAKIAGLAHEHGNAPVKTIGYMLGIGKMPPDYDQDLHNNALGVQIGKEAKSQEDLESRIQAILNSATKQPTPGQPWIGRPNIPNQISDYARGGKVSTNPFDHLV